MVTVTMTTTGTNVTIRKYVLMLLLMLGWVVSLATPAAAQPWFGQKGLAEFSKALTDASYFGVPRYATAALPTCGSSNTGAMAYDTTAGSLKVCSGSAWASAGGVSTTGTPANGQVALWSGASTLTGDTGLTYSGTGATFVATVNKLITGTQTSSGVQLGQGAGTQGAAATPYLTFGTYNTTGWYLRATDTWSFAAATAGLLELASGQVRLGTNVLTGGTGVTVSDVGLSRLAAGVYGIGNGTAADVTGEIRLQRYRVGGTAPTCSSNCGTSPSVVGSDSAGIVTMGATGSPASGFVITFAGTWAAAPSCVLQMAKAGMANTKLPLTAVTSTTTITVVTNGAAPANSDVYAYHCIGVQ